MSRRPPMRSRRGAGCPGAARQAARGAAVPPAIAALVRRDRNRSGHLLPCHRNHRQGRRIDGVVPEPGRRLRDVGGLSRPAGAQAIFSDPRAVLAWGPGPRVKRSHAKAVTGSPGVVVRLRRPARDLASAPIARSTGPTASPGREANGEPLERTMLVRTETSNGPISEHGRPARHRQRPVYIERFLRSSGPFDHPRVRPRAPRSRPALPHGLGHRYQVGFAGVACASPAVRSTISSKWRATRVPRG